MTKTIFRTKKGILILTLIILILNIFTSISLSNKSNLAIKKSDTIVTSFSWKNINGIDYTTPVKNQELCKSDAAFALVACLETIVQYELGYPFYYDLSEANLFFSCNGTCEDGVNISKCADYLVNHGVPDEGCFAYPERYYSPELYFSQPDWQNRSVKIQEWYWLDQDIQSIKDTITSIGPVCGLINYTFNFVNYKGGIYQPKGKIICSQWVAIIGYDDELDVWICKNSWDVEWGESGYVKIPYSIEWEKLLFINGTEGELNPNVPIVQIFQPKRGLKYTPVSRYKPAYLKIPTLNERASYVLVNNFLSKIMPNKNIDIRTPIVKKSCLIEICAVKHDNNAVVYIDDKEIASFNKTTLYTKMSFNEPGLHTMKIVGINEKGVKSVHIREFLVV